MHKRRSFVAAFIVCGALCAVGVYYWWGRALCTVRIDEVRSGVDGTIIVRESHVTFPSTRVQIIREVQSDDPFYKKIGPIEKVFLTRDLYLPNRGGSSIKDVDVVPGSIKVHVNEGRTLSFSESDRVLICEWVKRLDNSDTETVSVRAYLVVRSK
jgi:hypothetical protein